ncbi:outer membrane lipoprotein chaperone LolA [bacterium]|nr:outer membrane lipoprotein chaperone LolA [bacterium]
MHRTKTNKTWRAFSIFLIGFFANSALAIAEGLFVCQPGVKPKVPADIIETIDANYRGLNSLTAKFTQVSTFISLAEEETSRGEVRFKKPGYMDWKYQSPREQRFVADGNLLYFHEPKANQVTIADFKNAFTSDLPVSFLLGVGKLSENFSFLDACLSDQGLVLQLKAKNSDAGFQAFSLVVDAKTYAPLGAHLIDVGGNETNILLETIKHDDNIPATSFAFEIPKGTDVIDRRKTASALPVAATRPIQETNL